MKKTALFSLFIFIIAAKAPELQKMIEQDAGRDPYAEAQEVEIIELESEYEVESTKIEVKEVEPEAADFMKPSTRFKRDKSGRLIFQ